MDEIIRGRREEKKREIRGTQNLRPEKRLKLIGGVMIKGTKGATNIKLKEWGKTVRERRKEKTGPR